jgi:riboflavin kinase/FMN adenylyltransferase
VKIVSLNDAEPRARRLAVGVFDGVHVGHRAVIAGSDCVVTFDPHPRTVVTPSTGPQLLTTLERKAELIAALGVDELIVIPFDRHFAEQPPHAFVDDVLVAALGATEVAVGENFRFGQSAGGDAELLTSDGRFETRTVSLTERDGEIVSSAHIRGLIAGGAIEYAAELLGDRFVIDGEVVHGDKRGRELGFPTLNLVPNPDLVLPAHGIYACRVRVRGDWIGAAANIGVRPQFKTGRGELIEAFLMDWEGDAYGEIVRIEFIQRLRGEKRFESVDVLVQQMGADVQQARAILGC